MQDVAIKQAGDSTVLVEFENEIGIETNAKRFAVGYCDSTFRCARLLHAARSPWHHRAMSEQSEDY